MASKPKRGQGAAGAALLLAAIAGILVLFIILIPPQEREELLGDGKDTTKSTYTADTTPSSGSTELKEAKVRTNLLTVSPGRVDYLSQKEVEHPLPVINIYTRTEAKVLAEKNVAVAKKSVFSEENSVFKFNVPDLKHSGNFLLSFKVKSAEGDLVISLNGDEIFNSPVKDGDALTVNIPANSIAESNEMVISASSPGAAFWGTNEVSLESIMIVADVTNVGAQYAKNVFLVSEIEKNNLETVTLEFKPDCDINSASKLNVKINGDEVYYGIPDCELSLVPIEISPELIRQGENEIIFKTDKSDFVISHVVIKSELKDIEYPTYYFDLSYEQYQSVMDEDYRIRLKMDFVDVVTSKYGELVFNGHQEYFDTKDVSYLLDLSEDVVQGNNALKIKPKKTLEIREVKVDLVE